MAEYLAPGVYIEETTFRARSIEGVSTSTTAFVGPTRRGPIGGTPELLGSYADFERIYGGAGALAFGADPQVNRNYLALAVRAFFENGGSRLYVSRAYKAPTTPADAFAGLDLGGAAGTLVRAVARFPGKAGAGTITFVESRREVSGDAISRLPPGSVVEIEGTPDTYAVRTDTGWVDASNGAVTPPGTVTLLTVDVVGTDADGNSFSREGMSYGSAHYRYVGAVLAASPSRQTDHLEQLFALSIGASATFEGVRSALLSTGGVHKLTGGGDGVEPDQAAYTEAFAALERVTDISIVAAPGSSALSAGAAIRGALLTHVHARGLYRVAVLDPAPGSALSDVRTLRGSLDSDRAALYYPWVVVANPSARPGDASQPAEIAVPPSGFVAGIWARSDVERGVWKSPANEVVRGALRFERDLSIPEVESLNPLGVNCLRLMPGRGYRVWGARTAGSDPEWKYLSVRRYFHFLEGSIERGTQWAVFEPNGPALWVSIREAISSFLYNEWRNGALLGESEKEAYFVRCDRTTMTQNDLDNGRLVCLVGVAVVKPAEFVIIRIGQKTASARD